MLCIGSRTSRQSYVSCTGCQSTDEWISRYPPLSIVHWCTCVPSWWMHADYRRWPPSCTVCWQLNMLNQEVKQPVWWPLFCHHRANAVKQFVNSFSNWTSPSDNSSDRWKRLCLVSRAAALCVWMLRALTRNLLTYLLTLSGVWNCTVTPSKVNCLQWCLHVCVLLLECTVCRWSVGAEVSWMWRWTEGERIRTWECSTD